MRFRICLLLLCFVGSYGFTACTPRKIVIDQPTLAFETPAYVVIQTSPERFLILTKSNLTIDEIQKQLGCDKQHICSGQWNGEMWTIERLK